MALHRCRPKHSQFGCTDLFDNVYVGIVVANLDQHHHNRLDQLFIVGFVHRRAIDFHSTKLILRVDSKLFTISDTIKLVNTTAFLQLQVRLPFPHRSPRRYHSRGFLCGRDHQTVGQQAKKAITADWGASVS